MNERMKEHYIKLLGGFIGKIENLDVSGIPAVHIPAIGEYYEKAEHRIAFFGIETKGWGSLGDLREEYKNDATVAYDSLVEDFKNNEFSYWTNNFGTSFFNFIFEYLAAFYGIANWRDIREKEEYQYLLQSFMWGNTNALERYEVTAKQNKAKFDVWQRVKEESRIFDSASNAFDICRPEIALVLNWSEREEWLSQCYNCKGIEIDDHLLYYYIKETETHLYWLAHPRWLANNMGFKKAINSIIKDLENHGIQCGKPFNLDYKEAQKIIDKKEYLARLAMFLRENTMVMSGYELANHLNRNGIKTSYGTEYTGGRGIYRLVSETYSHFAHNSRGEDAENISLAFVKENGEYAYE